MQAQEADVKRKPPSKRYENLTPMEGALLDLQQDSNDRVVAAIEKLEAKAPSYRLVAVTAGSIVMGMLAFVVYLVSLIAESRGVDTQPAAESTKTVITAIADEDEAPAEEPGTMPEEVPGG